MQRVLPPHRGVEKEGRELMTMYRIIRYFSPNDGREREVILVNLTLEEAQEHCQREDTREAGVFFDGYEEE